MHGEDLPLPHDHDLRRESLDSRSRRQQLDHAVGPGADPDQDKFTNAQENIAGTDPTKAASLLKMQSVARSVSGATVTWQSVTNRHYQVMARTNASAGTWLNVGGVFTPSGTNSSILDSSATNTLRIYRVQALP